jgi:excisionase family DNA binding protein
LNALTPNIPDALWTVEDVAAYLKTSRSWVYTKVAAGVNALPAMRVGGLLRFKPDVVRAWADGTLQPSNVVTLKGLVR